MKKLNRVGEKHTTNEGYEIEIIEYFNSEDVKVKFNDKKGTVLENIKFSQIKKKTLRNPNNPTVYGVGYIGIGAYKSSVKKIHTKNYEVWTSMLERCYNKKCIEKNPTYFNITVCEEWYNFQNFAKWHEENWKPYMEGWHLDKDILQKGNKIYSPETCCFVHRDINSLFIKNNKLRGDYPIGVFRRKDKYLASLSVQNKRIFLGSFDTPEIAFQVYKVAKEKYIKEVAEIWKPLMTPQTYEALINYKVEIND